MEKFNFGKSSQRELNTCHPYLKLILERAISLSPIDFGISEGHRSIERQYHLFQIGRSKIDGINRKGKHNYSPSRAADIYIYTSIKKYRQKIAYDLVHLSFVAGVMFTAASQLKEEGKIKCDLRWGGNWNQNGIIDKDQSFDDYPHFEIVNIK